MLHMQMFRLTWQSQISHESQLGPSTWVLGQLTPVVLCWPVSISNGPTQGWYCDVLTQDSHWAGLTQVHTTINRLNVHANMGWFKIYAEIGRPQGLHSNGPIWMGWHGVNTNMSRFEMYAKIGQFEVHTDIGYFRFMLRWADSRLTLIWANSR